MSGKGVRSLCSRKETASEKEEEGESIFSKKGEAAIREWEETRKAPEAASVRMLRRMSPKGEMSLGFRVEGSGGRGRVGGGVGDKGGSPEWDSMEASMMGKLKRREVGMPR